MWYDVCFVLSIVLLGGGVAVLIDRLAHDRHPMLGRATLGVLVALVTGLGIHESFAESPIGYPSRMQWHQMRVGGDVPYIEQTDVAAALSALDSLAADQKLRRVQFYPFADALLFRSQMGERWLPVQPVFTESTADVVVVHISRYLPAAWDERTRRMIGLVGSGTWMSERDSTESWRIGVIRPR
jgi:hypothetical protein